MTPTFLPFKSAIPLMSESGRTISPFTLSENRNLPDDFEVHVVGLGLYDRLVARLTKVELIRGDGRDQRRPD